MHSCQTCHSCCRVYSLQRLIECAYHNLNRIRLIWSRLWAALAPHLVSAACHANPKVAAYAVDALRQLVAKLLVRAERAELTSFTHQDEALRPFVAVLKHCDSAAVREQTVQCIAQAITAHPRGLGSGNFTTYLVPDSSIQNLYMFYAFTERSLRFPTAELTSVHCSNCLGQNSVAATHLMLTHLCSRMQSAERHDCMLSEES